MPRSFDKNCRVCGLMQAEPVWGDDGNSPTFEICACCGVQFGYGDDTVDNCHAIRKHWIKVENMKWLVPNEKPIRWSWEQQKQLIPPEFRN